MLVKPGLQTTEFWATVVFDAAVLVAALADALPAKWAAIAGSVSTALYAISRGIAKQPPTILPVTPTAVPAAATVAPVQPGTPPSSTGG